MAEDYIYEVERILARRRTRKGKLEYMVRWKNFGSEEDTWEPLENLGDCMELVEEFNQKTMKDGKFERLASLDHLHVHKKLPQAGKKRPSDNGGKDKGGQGKERVSNGSDKNKEHAKAQADQKPVSSNSRTNSSTTVGKTADGSAKAQKRKRESDVGSKQTNGPVALPSTHAIKSEGQSPEKRVKRAHSVTGVGPQGTYSPSASSNGIGSPLQRRRINSTIPNEGLHHSTRGSPNLHRTMSASASAYPKLILSPTKLTMVTRRGGSPATLANSLTASSGGTEEDGEVQGRRTASIVARRRLSHSTPEDPIDSRRISARQSESLYKYKEIVVKKCQGYTQVRLFTTTPTRNALNLKALQELTAVFELSKKDDSKVIFLSGSGSVFCSGLDLRCIQTSFVEERKRASKNLADAVRSFVDSLINCPKLVVVAINGPAIGLGAAILPLCDIAYASDKAYFHLPYSILSQTPEGCASHTYPQVLGLALAGEMLYAGRKLTALEACACGLVSHTFWPTSFMQEVVPRVQRIASQSGKALLQSKLLMRGQMRAKLEYVNESECAALEERWRSPECHRQIKLFAENYSDM
ncbi:chromodomain Y-like protein 2 [Lytechinus variegatus]|uniref:chromodomain Y-like protein 2 n=1 Tax=Lytechinus variegatus TaxID=7654 RepID=UPI001BB24003|nr:chromodomain Y-like protein 2 [Lytechinus variegatus]